MRKLIIMMHVFLVGIAFSIPSTATEYQMKMGVTGTNIGGGGEETVNKSAWVTFANNYCSKSYSDYSDFESDSGPIYCGGFSNADVQGVNWPDRNLAYQVNYNATVDNVDFMSTLKNPKLASVGTNTVTDLSGLSNIETTDTVRISYWQQTTPYISDVTPLNGIVVTDTIELDYRSVIADNGVPEFGPGTAISQMSFCSTGCSGTNLTNLSGLANVDVSGVANGDIVMENKNYSVKAPAGSTFCQTFTEGMAEDDGTFVIPKSNLCN